MEITLRRPKLERSKTVARVPLRLTRTRVSAFRSPVSVVVRRTVRVLPAGAVAPWSNFSPDPYVNYARWLTPQGGIAIAYKDIDARLRHTLLRLLLWTAATGGEVWYLFHRSPVHNLWINLVCLVAIAIVNWLIVRKPVELYRAIEIRPDCMILEGSDTFWLRYMENGWPNFRPDAEGNQILSGIYGTRFVEYLTVRKFDEFDRAPEVFATHLQDAMRQLWTKLN